MRAVLSPRTANMPAVEYIAAMIFTFGARPADAFKGLVERLAGAQRDVERALLQQRNVLGRALGVAGLDRERMRRSR